MKYPAITLMVHRPDPISGMHKPCLREQLGGLAELRPAEASRSEHHLPSRRGQRDV
ncbi:hypothetical protein [Streptomyces griseoluteus]|uniref:hypothetical protein n=1 Tax=Streptomyces griseoluteus TaxID=29306 RepID=UPI00142ECA50|nr:hypothetical protein [Streptomyces griseoluteus]GHF01441.1 hypothetical protein GCM10017776_18450 [Streptomyces griseoluteus]